MPKPSSELTDMDLILIRNGGGKIGRIIRQDPVVHMISQSLTTTQDLSNQSLRDLESPDDHIFYAESIELENDIRIYLEFRSRSLFGFTGVHYIDQKHSRIGRGWPLNLWMYRKAPVARYINQLSETVTATYYIIGIDNTFEDVTPADKKEYAKLAAMATPVFG